MPKILVSLLALSAIAGCQDEIKCADHNVEHVPKVRSEFRDRKEYGVYEHEFFDAQRKLRTCRTVLECPQVPD